MASSAYGTSALAPAARIFRRKDNALRVLTEHAQHVVPMMRRVPTIEFSPDGRIFASADQSGCIILWDAHSEQVLRRMDAAHVQGVRSLDFRADGRQLVSGGNDGRIKIWDVATGRCLRTLEGHQQDVFAVRFSPDGRFIASGEKGPITPGGDKFSVMLWDAETGDNLLKLPRHKNMVFALAFAPDGRLLSCSEDGTLLGHDLHYFDRHIAGNLEAAILDAAEANESPSAQRIEQLRAWAHGVLEAR